MAEKETKVFLYGLDGVSWPLLDLWLNKGEMPYLKSFLKKGLRAVLETTIPTLTMPALPALYTGMNPGELGIFSLSKPTGEIITIKDLTYPRIWDHLGKEGLSSLIYNAKFTYPPDEIKGIMVSAGPYPKGAKDYTYPREVRKEIEAIDEKRSVDKEKVSKDFKNIDKRPEDHYLLCVEEMKVRFKRFLHLAAKDEFPFIFYWEGMTDAVQHRLWYHPGLLKRFFKEVDTLLGKIMEEFQDYHIFIVSDHGFHSSASVRFHVNNWLEDLSYLKRTHTNPFTRYLVNLAHHLARNYIPDSALEKMLSLFKKKEKEKVGGYDTEEDLIKRDLASAKSWNLAHLPGIDYRKSKAFQSEHWGIDVVNCKSKEEYEAVRETIIKKAERLRAPEKVLSFIKKRGVVEQEDLRQVFQIVKKREEVFKGPYLSQIPDIVFLTTPQYFPEYQLGSKIYTKPRGLSKRIVPGDHNRALYGVFAVSGSEVRVRGGFKSNVKIYDIMPTLLWLFGLELPRYLDGKVLTGLFKIEREVCYSEEKVEKLHTEPKKVFSVKEQKEMRERLKSMGYIDEI